jgi:hypothetical protein
VAPPSRVFGEVAAFGSADIGTVPSVGFGGGISVGLGVGRWHVDALAMGEPTRDAGITRGDGIGARLSAARFGYRACFAVLEGRFEVRPCVGEEVVTVSARGTGVRNPDENSTKWGEVAGGAIARWEFAAPVGIRVEGMGIAPLLRRKFLVAPVGVVHTVPALTSRFSVGVDFRF